MTENGLVSSLRSTADALKGADESTRKDLASGDIPGLIVEALRIAGESSFDDGSSKEYALQAARVAANLVVDDDENRETLHKIGYIQALAPVFKRYANKLVDEQELNEEEFGCLRAMIASLMNISLGAYEPIKQSILDEDILLHLLRITPLLHIPLAVSGSTSSTWTELSIARRGLADWCWKILDECSSLQSVNKTFTTDWIGPLITSLSGFAQQSSQRSRIEVLPDVNDEEEDDPEEVLEVETHILGSACTLMDKITAGRSDLLSGLFQSASTTASTGNEAPVITLLDFLENAHVPEHWKDCIPEPSDTDEEQPPQAGFDTDKFFGQAKAVLMKCVVEACAEADLLITDRTVYGGVWERFGGWMRMGLRDDCAGRGDLVGCALLAIGNQVRSDATVQAFASDLDLFSTYKDLLQNANIKDRQVRYAIVGLLRNLLLPDTLKGELGPLAIRAFEEWKVFDDEVGIQIMGPLVGGAMVALKHLCRGNLFNCLLLANETSFEAESGLMKSIIALGSKSDDVGIKCESARIHVNILRTLASSQDPQHHAEVTRAQERMADEGVVEALVQLGLHENAVLVGEGVMGLVLLTRTERGLDLVAKRVSRPETTSKLMARLLDTPVTPEPEASSSETDDLLTDPAQQRPAIQRLPNEIKSNLCVLLVALSTTRKKMIDSGGLTEDTKRGIVEGLEGFGEGEGKGDEGLKMAVAQALIAWQS